MSVLPAGAATLLAPEEHAAVRQAFAAYDRNGQCIVIHVQLATQQRPLGMHAVPTSAVLPDVQSTASAPQATG